MPARPVVAGTRSPRVPADSRCQGGGVRYTGGVPIAGRRREIGQIGCLLDRAGAGAGGLLVLVGPAGAGKTALLESAAGEARRRGFGVLRASPVEGQPGRLVWAQLLRDAGAPDDLAAELVGGKAGPLALDSAVRHLVSVFPRLILVDDIERGGRDAVEVLSVVAARCVTAATAVIAAAATPVGLGQELRLRGLSEADLATAAGSAPCLIWRTASAASQMPSPRAMTPGIRRWRLSIAAAPARSRNAWA